MMNLDKSAITVFFAAFAGLAFADAGKSDFQVGYEQGFIDGRESVGGGGGTHGLSPGDISFVPRFRGGGSSSDRLTDPFVMVFDGVTWSSMTLDAKRYQEIGGPELSDESRAIAINDGEGVFSTIDTSITPDTALKQLEANTGHDADQWIGAIMESDLSEMKRGLHKFDELNLDFEANQ